jgi:hypothetical protein
MSEIRFLRCPASATDGVSGRAVRKHLASSLRMRTARTTNTATERSSTCDTTSADRRGSAIPAVGQAYLTGIEVMTVEFVRRVRFRQVGCRP